MSNDIIVTARPDTITSYNFSDPVAGPTATSTQALIIFMSQIPNVEKESDVQGEDIVVIGQRLKQEITSVGLAILGQRSTIFNIPCIGSTNGSEIASLIQRLKFTITNNTFGPGRAGENGIGNDGAYVPVAINVDALRGYDALGGGLSYLVAHEIAHGLKSMQEYNLAMWNQYVASSGAELSHADRIAQYPNSIEFKQNEARANTVGQALMANLYRPPITFSPTNGYQTC